MEIEEFYLAPAFKVTLERAHDAARSRRHPEVTMLHLIHSLCEDPDACRLLTEKGVDPDAIRHRSLGELRRLIPSNLAANQKPVLDADVVALLSRAVAMVRAASLGQVDGRDVLGIVMDDAEEPGASKPEIASLIHSAEGPPEIMIDSSTWTGLSNNQTFSAARAARLLEELDQAAEKLDAMALDNSAKSQAYAYIVAAKVLAQAPEPPADLIWELISRLNAIAGIAGLLVSIIALMK